MHDGRLDRRSFLRVAGTAAAGSLVPVSMLRARAPRRLQTFDVKRYGAVGNGRADDRAAIQRALDAAQLAGGGTVHFPAGTFMLLSGHVEYGSNIHFVGEGARSIVRNGPDRERWKRQMVMAAADRPVEGVSFRSLLFDQRGDLYHNDLHSQCISVNGVRGAEFEDVVFDNVCTMAVWCDSRHGLVTSDVHVRRSTILRTAGGGFSFFGEIRDSSVTNCVIRRFHDDAIAFQDCPDPASRPRRILVRDNECTEGDQRDLSVGTTPNGVLIFGTAGAEVVNNRIDRTVANGIALHHGAHNQSERVRVRRNTVTRAGHTEHDTSGGVPGAGYSVWKCRDIEITDNSLDASRTSGVEVGLSADVTVSGNVLRRCGGAGLRVDNSTGVRVRENTVEGYGEFDVEQFGILVISLPSPSRNVEVTGNRVRLGTRRREQHALYIVGRPVDAVVEANDLRGHRSGALGGMAESAGIVYRSNQR